MFEIRNTKWYVLITVKYNMKQTNVIFKRGEICHWISFVYQWGYFICVTRFKIPCNISFLSFKCTNVRSKIKNRSMGTWAHLAIVQKCKCLCVSVTVCAGVSAHVCACICVPVHAYICGTKYKNSAKCENVVCVYLYCVCDVPNVKLVSLAWMLAKRCKM